MSQSIDVVMPDMGNFAEVGVIDVLVKPGDHVEIDTPLVTLETEKATMDVPSTVAGIVEKVHVRAGGMISAGALVVTVRSDAAAAAVAAVPAPASAPVPAPAAAAVAQSLEVRVPDMGNFAEVSVIDVLVKVGDTVAVDTPLVTLETEKATMDVPSTAAGVIAAHFDSLAPGQWQRTGSRSDGAHFTVESFARYFIHDPVHHLWDVTGARYTTEP